MPGWHYQQLLKIGGAFSPHVKTEHYFVMDSEVIFLRRHPLLADNQIFFMNDLVHAKNPPYYPLMPHYTTCIRELLGIGVSRLTSQQMTSACASSGTACCSGAGCGGRF